MPTPAAIKSLARQRLASWHAEQVRLGGNPPRPDVYTLRQEIGFARLDLERAAEVLNPREAAIRDLRAELDRTFSTDPFQDRLTHAPRRAEIRAQLEAATWQTPVGQGIERTLEAAE